MTILDQFIQFSPFRPFWMDTFSKMMGNFKILAKALPAWNETKVMQEDIRDLFPPDLEIL